MLYIKQLLLAQQRWVTGVILAQHLGICQVADERIVTAVPPSLRFCLEGLERHRLFVSHRFEVVVLVFACPIVFGKCPRFDKQRSQILHELVPLRICFLDWRSSFPFRCRCGRRTSASTAIAANAAVTTGARGVLVRVRHWRLTFP